MTAASLRTAMSVLVTLVLVGAACGKSNPSTTPQTSTTSAVSTTTTSSSATTNTTNTTRVASTTTLPQVATSIPIWPTTATAVRYKGPVAVARAFALDYLHFVDPIVGQFRQGDSRSGEVPIRTTVEGASLGPVTTVLVRQIDNSWWVLGAATPQITITQPKAFSAISSPVRLRGMSTAFEATVNVSIRQDNVAKPLVESHLMGGSNGQMGPFDASFTFPPPTSSYGAVMLYTISPANGHVAEATVIRVRLSSG